MTLTNKKQLIYLKMKTLFEELDHQYNLEFFYDTFDDAIGQFRIDADGAIALHELQLIDSGEASYKMEADTGFKFIKYNQKITEEV